MPSDYETIPVRSPAPAPEEELLPGSLLGEYEIEAPIARGGHGSVYAARHRLGGSRAAVKVLRREFAGSDEMLARFVREVRVVNRIRHPEIVDIFDLGTLPDGRPYCVMEFLDGRSLDAIIHERAPLAPAEAVALLAPVCRALQAAHEAGVVHRDVKASNVMVLSGPGEPRVKLLDFGIAKAVEPGEAGLTAVGQRLGTMGAMAPEQIVGKPVDARADVYAAGVLLFRLLTGRPPFSAPDIDEVERLHLEAPAPRPSELAPAAAALDAVVARSLEKSPERRWRSAIALLDAAQAALDPATARSCRRLALAVHVLLRLPPDPDDQALLGQADAAEIAEDALRGAGFQVPLSAAGVLLGVLPLPDGVAEGRCLREGTVEVARRLERELARPGLTVAVAVVVAEAEVRWASGGPEVVGGPACIAPPLAPGLTVGPGVL